MKKLNNLAIGIALSSAVFATQATAAVNGTLGVDSTGMSDISLSIVEQVQITGVSDIALGAFDGTNDLTGSTAFCVYRSGGDNYTMTITAQDGALEVASAIALDVIGFTVKVDGDNDASNGEAITYGISTNNDFTGSSAIDCGGANNASLEVNFAAADLRTATAATDYTATVVILIQPI
jgi:hypothetical protein